MVRIALLGGTYSPPTRAHLAMGVEILKQGYADTIHLIPNKASVLKETTATAEHRLTMLALALEHDPQLEGLRDKFQMNRCEVDRPGKSYMYTTLEALHADFKNQYDAYELMLVIGQDSLLEFTKWYRWQDILALCQLVVFSRPGYMDRQIPAELVGRYTEVLLDLDISSTQVRKKLATGEPTDDIILPIVRAYIDENMLFQPTQVKRSP